MNDHKKILELIEDVDPDEEDCLDEIDARVWCFIHGKGKPVFKQKTNYTLGNGEVTRGGWGVNDTEKPVWFLTEYTRSRDALKSIRPDGWQVKITHCFGSDTWQCSMTRWGERSVPLKMINSLWEYKAPTEELAELHAIVQAIAFDRGL